MQCYSHDNMGFCYSMSAINEQFMNIYDITKNNLLLPIGRNPSDVADRMAYFNMRQLYGILLLKLNPDVCAGFYTDELIIFMMLLLIYP